MMRMRRNKKGAFLMSKHWIYRLRGNLKWAGIEDHEFGEVEADLQSFLLLQYEADNGPLTANQVQQIRQRSPQGTKRSVRSSLVELSND